MGCIVYGPNWLQTALSFDAEMGNYILASYVGLSALLVSTDRVMRRPTNRGTSDRIGSTFLICIYIQIFNYQ